MANGDAPIKVKGGSIEITLQGTGLKWTASTNADQWSVSGTEGFAYLVEVELGNDKTVKIPKSHATVRASSGERVKFSLDGNTTTVRAERVELSSDGDTTTVKANVELVQGPSITLRTTSPEAEKRGAATIVEALWKAS
jgi:hypothetical protein